MNEKVFQIDASGERVLIEIENISGKELVISIGNIMNVFVDTLAQASGDKTRIDSAITLMKIMLEKIEDERLGKER